MKKEIRAEQATYVKDQILRIKASMGQGYFLLGELLKKIRDERLYRLLDYQTMGAFIAQPELAFSRTSVYDYIHMYEMYVLTLAINPKDIVDIQYSQLRKILPVVRTDPEEWIEKARTLSRADLTIEVRGNQEEFVVQHKNTPDLRTPLKLNASKTAERIYMNLIKQIEVCPVCGKEEDLTPAHFPRTHARGGKEEDWKRIPLCLQCHSEADHEPNEWLVRNKYAVFDFFYHTLLEVIKIKEEK